MGNSYLRQNPTRRKPNYAASVTAESTHVLHGCCTFLVCHRVLKPSGCGIIWVRSRWPIIGQFVWCIHLLAYGVVIFPIPPIKQRVAYSKAVVGRKTDHGKGWFAFSLRQVRQAGQDISRVRISLVRWRWVSPNRYRPTLSGPVKV